MNTLTLSRERRARVWLEELPAIPQEIEGSLVQSARINAPIRHLPAMKRVAIELFVPLGGRFMYGLLGVELLGRATSVLEVLVPVSRSRGCVYVYEDSLASTFDHVQWSLPDEYAGAVVAGARAGVLRYGPPDAAAVRFGVAAHGDVGSAPSVFERLSKALVGLLVVRRDEVADLAQTVGRLLE